MAKETHAVMKSSLAKALMESGVQHFDLGGILGGAAIGAGVGGFLNPMLTAPAALAGGVIGSGGNLPQIGLPQNGFQAQLAPTTQTDYTKTIDTAQQASTGVNPQQTALAQALLAQSQGQGPNPAQAALNQATGANVANQSALMAGARGAGGNVGLQSVLAARQGANIQQQAVGHGATMQAQQQLGAQNQLQNLYGQQQAGANQLLQVASGAQNQQNTGQVENYKQAQGTNAATSQANTNANNSLVGGLINGLAGGVAHMFADGGSVLPLADGGAVPGMPPHPGNDVRNDTELALLSKGEAVIPNSVMQSANPGQKAKEFIEHLRGEGEKKSKKDSASYEHVAGAKKSLKERIEHLEKLCMGGKVA